MIGVSCAGAVVGGFVDLCVAEAPKPKRLRAASAAAFLGEGAASPFTAGLDSSEGLESVELSEVDVSRESVLEG